MKCQIGTPTDGFVSCDDEAVCVDQFDLALCAKHAASVTRGMKFAGMLGLTVHFSWMRPIDEPEPIAQLNLRGPEFELMIAAINIISHITNRDTAGIAEDIQTVNDMMTRFPIERWRKFALQFQRLSVAFPYIEGLEVINNEDQTQPEDTQP